MHGHFLYYSMHASMGLKQFIKKKKSHLYYKVYFHMSMILNSLIWLPLPMPMPHFLSYCNIMRLLYLVGQVSQCLVAAATFRTLQSAILALFLFHMNMRVSLSGPIKYYGWELFMDSINAECTIYGFNKYWMYRLTKGRTTDNFILLSILILKHDYVSLCFRTGNKVCVCN